MALRAFIKFASWTGGSSSDSPRPRRSGKRRGLTIEPLEERRVLSADSFLTALYQQVLNRAPDPGGAAVYTAQLAAGTPSSTVVAEVWESAEHRGMEVDNFYQTYFNRAPDADGRQNWINSMEAGMTEESLMATLLTSTEFQQINPLPTQFVTALYHDVLGRDPDAAGQAHFESELAGGATPVSVVEEFINSTERHVNVVNSYYATFLGRAPDADGQSFWVQQLDQGVVAQGVIAEALQNSAEYVGNNFLLRLVAVPGEVVVNVAGSGFVTDSTGQIDTRIGKNFGFFGPTDHPILQAGTTNVTWSLYPTQSGITSLALDPSSFATGLNVTATFS